MPRVTRTDPQASKPPRSRARTACVDPHPPRWLQVVALASIAIAVKALTVPYPAVSDDIWLHLKAAEYVWHHRSMPPLAGPDLYSFTARHPYIAHSWLAAIVFSLTYSAAGMPGLIVLKVLVASAAYTIVYKTMRLVGSKLSVMVPMFAVLLCITVERFVERPMIFTSLMMMLYVWIFFASRLRATNRLYVLPPLQALWANLHGAQIRGVILVTCFAVGESLRASFAARAQPASQ
jgi:hypothetical protein